MPYHKGHFLRRDIFSSDNQIALIFTICGVQYYNEFTTPESTQTFFNAVEVQLWHAIGSHLDLRKMSEVSRRQMGMSNVTLK